MPILHDIIAAGSNKTSIQRSDYFGGLAAPVMNPDKVTHLAGANVTEKASESNILVLTLTRV
jgi:hypothetical protein